MRHLPSRIRRMRYFRGHGVHSPYIYDIVRHVFMRSTFTDDDNPLYDALVQHDIVGKRAIQLQNLMRHCKYTTWAIDTLTVADMLIVTLDTKYPQLEQYATFARENGITLCIMNPYNNAHRWEVCKGIIESHPSTTVDNRGYLLIFNNHLPKQQFRL